jgi:broad specificity phosphatase PhoE
MATTTATLLGYEAIQRLAVRHPLAADLERFVFLRHGETDGNRTGTFQSPETPLNANGEAQAQAAAERLKGQTIGHIVASPMARAWRTANVAAAHHTLLPEPEAMLQERFYMALAGTPVGTLNWQDDPPGCETLARFVHRTARGLNETIAAHAGRRGDLLIVSHGGILLVLAAMAGIAPDDASLRRNAVPILVTRQNNRWTFAAIG